MERFSGAAAPAWDTTGTTGKIQYSYNGPTTTAMDEASHTYSYSSDGLDRLKSVTEPNCVTSYVFPRARGGALPRRRR